MQTGTSKHSFHAVFQVLCSYLDKVFKEINVDTLLWAMGPNYQLKKELNHQFNLFHSHPDDLRKPRTILWHVLPSEFALEIPRS